MEPLRASPRTRYHRLTAATQGSAHAAAAVDVARVLCGGIGVLAGKERDAAAPPPA